jgi:hypothetical protein
MEGISSFEGTIWDERNTVCAKGDVKVYYCNNINEFLE